MLGRKPSHREVHRVWVRHACCLLTVHRERVGDINHSWISVVQVEREMHIKQDDSFVRQPARHCNRLHCLWSHDNKDGRK